MESKMKEELIKSAIQLAIYYCEEHIQTEDSSWTVSGLREYLNSFTELQKELDLNS